MNGTHGTHLSGLEAVNPLAFLAALGVQVAFEGQDDQPKLWWSDDLTPHAVVSEEFSIGQIADRSAAVFPQWLNSPAMQPGLPRNDAKTRALKLKPENVRKYLKSAQADEPGNSLAAALLAEGSLDNNNIAKPSDLYFTAGKQIFMEMARKVLKGVTHEDISDALEGQWHYNSELPSLNWDVIDDRNYALSASDPSKIKKTTNPGVEALAVLGLSLYPVFAGKLDGKDRTLTQGCSGQWTSASFSWPIWNRPATPHAVKSLLAHASHNEPSERLRKQLPAWGVQAIRSSPIGRSSQGGYGTFSPSGVVWRRP